MHIPLSRVTLVLLLEKVSVESMDVKTLNFIEEGKTTSYLTGEKEGGRQD